MEQGIEEAKLERLNLEREKRKTLIKDIWTEVFKHVRFETAKRLSGENRIFRDLFLIKLQKSKELRSRLIKEYEKRILAYLDAFCDFVQNSGHISFLQNPLIKDLLLQAIAQRQKGVGGEAKEILKENDAFVSEVFDNLSNKEHLIDIFLQKFRKFVETIPLNHLHKWVLYVIRLKDFFIENPNSYWNINIPELSEYIKKYVSSDILLLYDELKQEIEEYSIIFDEDDQEKYNKFANIIDTNDSAFQMLSQINLPQIINQLTQNPPQNPSQINFSQILSQMNISQMLQSSYNLNPESEKYESLLEICDYYVYIPDDEYMYDNSKVIVDKYKEDCLRIIKLKLFKLSEKMSEADVANLSIMEETCGDDLVKLDALYKLLKSSLSKNPKKSKKSSKKGKKK